MKIPFPPGMSPEEQRRHLEETERKLQQWREERERSLEQALATVDVVTLAARWREEMTYACERTHGPDFEDIEDMSRITLALATAAAAEGKPHESLSKLHVVLGEFNGSLRSSRHQFGLSQQLTQLRQAAALEINALVIAHQAGAVRASVRKDAAAVELGPPSEGPAARKDPPTQVTVGSITQPMSDPSEAPTRAGPRILDLADLIPDPASSRSPSPGAMLTPPCPPPTLAAFNVDPLGVMLSGRTVYEALYGRMQLDAIRERQNQSAMEAMNLACERVAEGWNCLQDIRDELRAERERDEEEALVDANGIPALMTGAQAATQIGVGSQTLSRWRSDVPAWATGNITLFTHLMDRERGKYRRHNVLKLAKWFKAAQDDGGQRPVPCP